MKPIFGRGPSLQLRLFFAVMLSASLMLADSRLGAFSHVRFLLNSLVAPIQYAADLPRVLFDDFYDSISSHQQLRENNQLLKREVLTLKVICYCLSSTKKRTNGCVSYSDPPFCVMKKKVVTK